MKNLIYKILTENIWRYKIYNKKNKKQEMERYKGGTECKRRMIGGITLIALIISIILIFILTAATIKNIIDDKTIEKSEQAVDDTKTKITKTQEDINELKKDWNEIEEKINTPD